ncbi:MAG: preprotein translocase subunit SecE [Miltoncostaeaceae bacterium]|jgi:preprotein translocase subunit SecE|nr:preprotein translocase subunit SecE [Miltoncostaeaceae bacterium]
MARIRPGKSQTSGQDPKLPAPAEPRRAPAKPAGSGRARPTPTAKTAKAGSFTKAVQVGRLARFFNEVIVELRKVSWPTRTQLLQSTAIVVVAVAIVAAYFAVLDFFFRRLVDAVF